jgi:V8-like Glu-specific endopeptidase
MRIPQLPRVVSLIARLVWLIIATMLFAGCSSAQDGNSTAVLLQEQRRLLAELRSVLATNQSPGSNQLHIQDFNTADSNDAFPKAPKKKNVRSLNELLQIIHSNDIRLQEIYGPESETNPRYPQDCNSVDGRLGKPDPSMVTNLLPSVGIVVDRAALKFQSDGSYLIDVEQHGPAEQLCPEVCFWSEYRYHKGSGLGTCFLINSNSVLTAKHVYEDSGGRPLAVVLNYTCSGAKEEVERIPKENVYQIVNYPKMSPNDDEGDWIVASLDHASTTAPLSLRTYAANLHESVFIIGHPFALPAIVAGDAQITTITNAYFYASLDASGGDSGAPVFDSHGQVVGIFKEGGDDLDITNGSCYKPIVIVNPDAGQKCTSISAVKFH